DSPACPTLAFRPPPVSADGSVFDRERGRPPQTLGTSPMSSQVIAEPLVQNEYLELQVQRRLGSRVRDLRIVQRSGGVVLLGRASTYHAKQLAQHAAMEILRVPIVANEIEVC